MSDSAKKTIISVSGCYLGTTFLEDNWDKDVIGIEELQRFLEVENVITLYAIIEVIEDNKRLKFFSTVSKDHYDRIVIFTKTKPCIPQDDAIFSNIQITSLSGSATLALYQSLSHIYAPLLDQQHQSVQRHLANLQNDLRNIILSESSEDDVTKSSVEPISLTVVNSVEQEIAYWNAALSSNKKIRIPKTVVTEFMDILALIARDFSIIDGLPLNDVEDLLEKAHNVLDDLWRHDPPYPKNRIKHIMDIIDYFNTDYLFAASNIWKFCSSNLKNYDLWEADYSQISDLLLQHISIGEKWLGSCKQLTEIFWPNYSMNAWKEGMYQPQDLVDFIDLLQKILKIRTLHKQLVRLLSPQEQDELKTKDMFEPFRGIDILYYGQDSSHSVLKAEKQFEYLIQPAERRVAIKLKKQLSTVNANTRQLIYEFSRYSELISRPVLKQELLAERQFLLTSLFDYIKQIQSQSTSENTINTRHDTPQVVKEIIMIRQLEAKANEIKKVSQKLLDDLQGYPNLNQLTSELVKELKDQHNELFEAWSTEIVTGIRDNKLSLKETDPVVQFSKQKLMRVNFSPRLVILISEVRQLKAMGYHVPSVIEETSEHAKKFMKFARVLEQIANFHNTIGDRMITVQKPMMLASAVELSKLVQEQEVVSWGDEKSVERYVDTLKKSVEKLSKENNLLTTYHLQVMEKIRDLEDVDLIKEYTKWKDTTRHIRSVMSQVEDKGFKNMQTWKNELDKKLSEVLEKQYITSLDSLHLYLPEIHTDLVYRNSELEFLPNEESLKKLYQQQLKKFLDIPRSFRGVADVPENKLFNDIIERNKAALESVSKHTEDLFEQLHGVVKHWQSWLQLDTLDTSKLSTWQHWDLHFRASKTFGQEIAKLPSAEERVGCFLIGLSRLRSDLESHNRSYWDQLVFSLKDSIAQDIVKLQNYIDPSTAALTRQPVTIEEVGESGITHGNILKEAPEMQATFDEMLKKSQILASWSREQIDSVNRLKGAWERLQSLLDNHQHIIAKQMETIRTTLNIEKENICKEIERFTAKWEQVKPRPHSGEISHSTINSLNVQLLEIKEKKVEWEKILERRTKLMADYTKFNFDQPDIPTEDIEADINKEKDSWEIFEEFNTELQQMANEFWIVLRKKIYVFEDFLKSWQQKLNGVENTPIVTRILREIHKYQIIAPLLKYVKGEDFSEKHWLDTFSLLKIETKPVDQLVLNDFLEVSDKLEQCVKELQMISKKAASEIIVRQALAELDQWDVQARFVLTPHKDSQGRDVLLVKEFKEILNKIGDNQSLLQSVKNSADYESFAEKANVWENKLGDLDHFLTSLAQVQRKWIYLEPIFGGGTLAHEKNRFDRVDRDFRHILNFIEKDLRVAALCRYPNLRSLLEGLLDQLSRCQHSLDNFLKEKRDKFPRFLFLSDDDLLEVVGQSSKEHVIQSHLKKIFAGIHSVQMDKRGENIISMCSLQGEVVDILNPVNIKQPVEEWLNALVKEMQATLKELLVNAQREKQAPDPLKYPSQILCLSDSITFTSKCEQAITSMTLPPLLAKYKAQLTHYSSLELNGNSLDVSDGENILELKLKALLLDTIHHISVLQELLDSNVMKVSDWVWQKQLRYYSNSTGVVTVKMANARMEYSYEYLGNALKLVRTPLTERCFLSLSQGIHLGMGGNPYGPAGTGKTESVKALGGLLGRQVLVFNCDEGIDAASMGRILTGLVRSGAWGCFDEFNRLDEATLSAVSMLIHPIQVSLRTNKDTVNLLDAEVPVNKHCGIFVTLNPAGGGYGGRNKLPDNLKQLFRPVVMTHPDHEQIARSILLCDGYQNADLIAKKLIEVFDISSKLLSKQQHYDWGLRSIKTVLTGCGRTLKKIKSKVNSDDSKSTVWDKEAHIVVQVLRMDTLSKLTFSDSIKFDCIVKDVFKDVDLALVENNSLKEFIEKSFQDLGLIRNDRQTNKCLEFFEQLQQRMGVAIVGPPSSGKSTIRNLIFHALSKMNKQIKSYCFNPKSMERHQLLGKIDPDTKQWSDGVLTNYSLQVASEGSDVWSWIVCDGDIDPDWVESLNSVLDDNRLLSLPSGWRIQFGPKVNFIFETHELSHASPATISRMGIIFLSEEDLDINNYVNNFISNLREEQKSILEPLISDYFLKALNWVVKDGETTVPCSKVAVASTGLSQLTNVNSKPHFSVALINGLGQQLQDDFREIFAQEVYQWTGDVAPPLPLKSRYNKERDMIESYYTNPNTTIEDISSGLPLVQTGQICQYLDVLRLWLAEKNEQHFLIVGQHGSAKTLLLKYLTNERSDMEIVTIHCSANLAPSFVIGKLAEHCIAVNTHKGKVFKPKKGNLVLLFKNINLLKPDKWGTNILIEFLNQVVKYKGFFDAKVEFVGVENVTIVGSLTAVGRLSRRFASNVHVFNVNLPEQDDLAIILSAYLSAILKQLFPSQSWPKAKTVKLASSMISVYDKIRNHFTHMKSKHYNFSPHDLTNWCQGLLQYSNNQNLDIEQFILEIVSYESMKIFGTKLIDDEDNHKFYSILNEIMQTQWGISNMSKKIIGSYYVPTEPTSRSNQVNLNKLTTEEWGAVIKMGISQYEREGQILDVTLNDELLDLTSSITKAVSRPNGNAMLIGRSGIGRKTSVKIVSALRSAKLIVPAHEQAQFNIDLKMAIQAAGLDSEEVYVQLEDQHFKNDDILNVVNLLVFSGEVPGLYSTVELESIVKILKDEYDRENFDGSLINFFSERIKTKLHVIACLDINNENLWNIVENCPAFTQKSTIIWKSNWSAETIANIPKILLEQNIDNKGSKKTKCSSVFSKIYHTTKSNITTPSRYVSMVRLYEAIYDDKLAAIEVNQNKLKAGVAKLTEAENLVKTLKQEAAEQQTKLEEKQSKANAALDMISNTMRNANSHKEEMESLKSKTEEENKQLIKRKKEIEEELSEVEPLIQEARAAVGNIKSESLSEIRSLRAPPDVIRDILEGVLRLMGIQDTSWNSMKTFLAKRGVKEEIRSFDASRIITENRQAVEKLISTKSESFDAKSAKRASVAAAPLAAWVAANVKYSRVLDKIRPLEREQNKLKQNLSNSQAQLGELSAGLLDVDATVAKLKEQLSAYTKEAAEIEIGLNKAQETLAAAEGLVAKLRDEYERWQNQLKELSEETNNLPDNCLIASAFISFLSGESEDKRKEIMDSWSKETGLSKIEVESFFSTEREQLQWQSEGLSSDKLSMQNAIIILKGKLVPLLIDPTSSATTWIKQHLKHKNVECATQDSPKFKNSLELAVRFGKTFVIEEVDSVSPILLPILRKEFVYQGERKLVKLNGKLVDHHTDFKLILCSRNEQISLTADVAPLINLLNFTVTHAGLTEQLLSGAIRQENPELETKKKQLLREKEELQEKQYDLQNQLLEDLANCKGDILQDKKLLTSLNETKASSQAISIALKESTEVQSKLQAEYDVYREISTFASSLYFACNDFAKSNVLYLISASAFTKLFLKSLQTFQSFENNLDQQKKHLLNTVYTYMSRGIFKNDRLKFLLHIVFALFSKHIRAGEWNLFLGNVPNKGSADEIPYWIPKPCTMQIQNLQVTFPEFYDSLQLGELNLWKNFMNASNCELEFPSHCKLTDFQKVLVVQALRPDRLHSAMSQCALHISGLSSFQPNIQDLAHVYKESNCNEPLLLLAMSGSDPSSEITELAQNVLGSGQYVEVAMGEGQETKALAALQICSESGTWLILKNLHLVTYWLPILSQHLKNLSANENFRLWLISEPTPLFNFVLAQNSLKLVYEAPQGLKNNILRTYSTYGNKYIEKLDSNAARIFFVMSCVHALLQERRKYIPQGWSKYYDFSDTDFSTMIKLVEDIWQNQAIQTQWKFISGLCSDAVYGGRIENVDDMKIVESYTKQYFVDEVLSHRWKPFGLNIALPTTAQFQEYTKAIKQLPSKDEPVIFGLADNINRAWERQTSASIISELKDLHLSNIVLNKFDQEHFQKGLAPFMNMWKKLNQGHDFLRMTLIPMNETKSAVEIFLHEEFLNGVILLQTIHKCFASLNKVCKGHLIPEDKDLAIGFSLLNFETPKMWLNLWCGPKEPSHYLRTVVTKVINLSKWKNEDIKELLKKPLNMSGLFHSEAFLASYKQDYSRNTGIPLDQLTLQTSWKQTNSSLILSELLVEGGIFENGNLTFCTPASENINTAPNCYLAWIDKKHFLEDDNQLNVPLYTNSNRDNKVILLQVPCNPKFKDKWILTGLAFYLEY